MSVLPKTQDPNLAASRLGSLKIFTPTKRTAELGDVFVIGDDIFGLSRRKGKRRAVDTIEPWSEPASP